MTRISTATQASDSGGRRGEPQAAWRLQDAKAQFSEVVRRAAREGPQHVTVHGREAVVVVSAAEYQRLKGTATGQSLIDALQGSPFPEISLEPTRQAMAVRDVGL